MLILFLIFLGGCVTKRSFKRDLITFIISRFSFKMCSDRITKVHLFSLSANITVTYINTDDLSNLVVLLVIAAYDKMLLMLQF